MKLADRRAGGWVVTQRPTRGSQAQESRRELYTPVDSRTVVQTPAKTEPDGGDPFEPRLASILEVARLHRTGIPVDDLAELLPANAPSNGDHISRWLAEHPHVGEVVGARAVRPGAVPISEVLDERRARGLRYRMRAETLVRETFGPVAPLLRCVGVTGSAAYLEPEAGDDLDLLIITRAGSLWIFLAYAYLALRLGRRPAPADSVDPCMNYVMDDAEARREFARPQGFLFAREALTTRPLAGADYLRGLVGVSGWLGKEVPRLYARWTAEGPGSDPSPRPAPHALRLLNAFLFVPLAAYLQAVGLVRNHRLQRGGKRGSQFRTVTEFARLTFESRRFDALGAIYAGGSSTPDPEPGVRA
jgi:hypothetical protein